MRRKSPVLLALAAAVYFVAAAVGVGGAGASAQAVARGRIWLLLTSALDPQGSLPVLQVVAAAALAALFIACAGARAWWIAALSGHVGSALLAYAVIGGAIVLGSGSAVRAASTSDYGVSCVLGATAGALLAVGVRRRHRLMTASGAVAAAAVLPFSAGWYGIEHPLAVIIGALVAARVTSSGEPGAPAPRAAAGGRRPVRG